MNKGFGQTILKNINIVYKEAEIAKNYQFSGIGEKFEDLIVNDYSAVINHYKHSTYDNSGKNKSNLYILSSNGIPKTNIDGFNFNINH